MPGFKVSKNGLKIEFEDRQDFDDKWARTAGLAFDKILSASTKATSAIKASAPKPSKNSKSKNKDPPRRAFISDSYWSRTHVPNTTTIAKSGKGVEILKDLDLGKLKAKAGAGYFKV